MGESMDNFPGDRQDTDAPLDPGVAVSPQLFLRLRNRIVRGELEPGTRLSEVDVAAFYSTSRQPVREAFIKLSEAGLIDIRPQRGSFVSRIDVASVLAAQFVREAVEADIVRAATDRADADMLAELDGNIAAQESPSMTVIRRHSWRWTRPFTA